MSSHCSKVSRLQGDASCKGLNQILRLCVWYKKMRTDWVTSTSSFKVTL
jgi:hypothetical protein